MRRELRILLVTVLLGAVWTWGGRVPEALARVEAFRVRDVDIRGLRYVTRDDALRTLGITAHTSVWADTGTWAQALREHPLVERATVERVLPDALVVEVLERRPVAFVPTPTLEPVDREGVRLPLDPARYRLDLPVVTGSEPPPPGSRLVSDEVRQVVAEVARLMAADTAFLQMISEVHRRADGTLVARWTDPTVDFLLPPGVSALRLREGIAVLSDALARETRGPPTEIDLRYADQVVVRRAPGR